MTETADKFDDSSRLRTVLFAGGGTGGHLYPGIAIAEQIKRFAPAIDIRFLCSRKPLDGHILTEEGIDYQPVSAQPFALRPLHKAAFAFMGGWFRAIRESGRLFDHYLGQMDDPRAIHLVLMGGYIAPPVARAASRRGIPITLVNLDVVPGKANRLAARWADEIVSAVACDSPGRFSEARVVGMPVRRRAVAADTPARCRSRLGLAPDMRTLLITGASQGAATINNLVCDMAADSRYRPGFAGWQLLHLAGPNRVADLEERYEEAGVSAVVLPFCHEMGDAWGSADLAISRAGASSVAEAVINGVPTIFLPYPWHKDNHQEKNAEGLVNRHGAWVYRDSVDSEENMRTVAPHIMEIMEDENLRNKVRFILRGGKIRNAAEIIARKIIGIRI